MGADPQVELDGHSLTREQVLAVAVNGARPGLAREALARVEEAAAYVERKVAAREVIYGVTTGFGRNADRVIGPDKAGRLQRNLLLSHTAGVGEPLPAEIVRAMMVVRVNTLLQGHSGIRRPTLELLVAMIERGVHPVIPRLGSVGASGDLAPLAHMAVVLLGEGEAEVAGERLPGGEALRRAGLEPATLSHKEGLSLVNGTSLMAALAIFALDRAQRCCRLADVSGALALEALAGRRAAFDPDVHRLRPHPGQMDVAANLLSLTEGSTLLDIPYEDVPRSDGSWTRDALDGRLRGGKVRKPQDAYSFRCMPQVHGAVRDTWAHAAAVVDCELNAVTDNPILFPGEKDRVISAGNFHGMPLALAMACLKVALPALAAISERRLAALVDDATNDGLPRFLIPDQEGVDSGVMLLQYTAAALVNKIATRAHPAAVHSIPTCANSEDHVSMGVTEGLDLLEMVADLDRVLALELLVGAQALDLRRRLLEGQPGKGAALEGGPEEHRRSVQAREHRPGKAVARVHARIRTEIPFIERDDDVELQRHVRAACHLAESGAVLAAAEEQGRLR